MTRALAIVLVCLCACLTCAAQRTTRPGLRTARSQVCVNVPADTTLAARDSDFTLFGYEKTLRSRTEAVFVTNRTAVPVTAIIFQAKYSTISGHELHSRRVRVPTMLSPGQTLQIVFPAWDKQQVWHYRLSPPSARSRQATPFDVAIAVDSFTTLIDSIR